MNKLHHCHTHTHTHTYTHTHTHTHSHSHTHRCMYTQTHTHTHSVHSANKWPALTRLVQTNKQKRRSGGAVRQLGVDTEVSLCTMSSVCVCVHDHMKALIGKPIHSSERSCSLKLMYLELLMVRRRYF